MEILLATLNATYQHTAFGLRYLYANMRELQRQTQICEFTLNHQTRDIVESLLALDPKIVGLGVYVWNAEKSLELVTLLKKIRPEIKVILGGPEVSYETAGQRICQLADTTIQGEGDVVFREICLEILSGKNSGRSVPKFVSAPLPDLVRLHLPYDYYSTEDIAHRLIYVEASRGCPFKCEFCVSSLDTKVRAFDLSLFLNQIDHLISRGARQFKFVDRTFNLNITVSSAILRFFLERITLGLFLHFEMVPDRLPPELKDLIKQFPAGTLQFEIGVQTWSEEVAGLISRHLNKKLTSENFQFLVNETHTHIHADLIIGLPGETVASFRDGFEALYALRPHEIQLGVLKRLRGTPIARHENQYSLIYEDKPPYTILKTSSMSFNEIQELSRLAKFWDLYANSGNFPQVMKKLEDLSLSRTPISFFDEFFEFSNYLNGRHPQRYAIALVNLAESAWHYLLSRGIGRDEAEKAVKQDFCAGKKRDIPLFLRKDSLDIPSRKMSSRTPSRQQRHLIH